MRSASPSVTPARSLGVHCFVLMFAIAALALAIVSLPLAWAATLSGATGAHDPSRMVLCNGKYYVYATGGGMKFSSDGIHWTSGPSPFSTAAEEPGAGFVRRVLPPSLKAVLPVNQGIWAPDVIYYHNRYLLYYSACAPHGINRCGIGLLTNTTLDPSAPDYKWTDAGVVLVTENMVEKKSAIDPGPFVDAEGNLWLSWGSGYANGNRPTDPTIVISKLDNATGLRSTDDTRIYPVAPGHIEASYVHYRAGYYYAFWNDGGCCNGVNSTYRIHVARATSPQGPYANKAGTEGAGDIFMASEKDRQVYGPGQIGIESEPGLDRFSFHYYNADGRPVLGFRTLVWDSDGWPSVGQDLSPGTYKIAASNGLALGIHGRAAANGKRIELARPASTDLQRWSVAVTADGYYRLTSISGGEPLTIAPSRARTASATINPPAAIDPLWIIELTSDGKTYRVTSCVDQDVLVSSGDTRKKSAPVTTAPWSNLPTQKWTFSTP
jgi:arabinan endo-1,5-alpha-L-arabinosidase